MKDIYNLFDLDMEDISDQPSDEDTQKMAAGRLAAKMAFGEMKADKITPEAPSKQQVYKGLEKE